MTKRKNISKTIPNGRTVQTRDEYFEGDSSYRKPGYEAKGLYRKGVVVDSTRDDEVVLVLLTKSKKGKEIPDVKVSKYRPYVETLDDEGKPIKLGSKFKENKANKDISKKSIASIKKETFKDSARALENRKKVRELKGRKK